MPAAVLPPFMSWAQKSPKQPITPTTLVLSSPPAFITLHHQAVEQQPKLALEPSYIVSAKAEAPKHWRWTDCYNRCSPSGQLILVVTVRFEIKQTSCHYKCSDLTPVPSLTFAVSTMITRYEQ